MAFGNISLDRCSLVGSYRIPEDMFTTSRFKRVSADEYNEILEDEHERLKRLLVKDETILKRILTMYDNTLDASRIPR
jgi:hypothetical protein